MPNGGAVQYSQKLFHSPETNADENVRAGFILIPLYGASNAINKAINIATKEAVYLLNDFFVLLYNTVVMRRKEIKNSRKKATPTPAAEGIVMI